MSNDKTTQANDGTTPAPEGYLYVCLACGKTSPTRYGFDARNKNVAMSGWDESCSCNAEMFPISRLTRNPSGRVTKIAP